MLRDMFKKTYTKIDTRYRAPEAERTEKQEEEPGIPAGMWRKCNKCGKPIYVEDVRENFYVCPKCGHRHGCCLSNGLYQCTHCHHQTSVTVGTVLHHSHVSLSKWFLAFYFVSQDKRGISAVQLSGQIGVTYKTAWSMLRRIRSAMGQRDAAHMLSGVVEFDDAYFGGPKAGGKRGRGTEKAKVFVALSLDERGNPRYLKMSVTKNIKQASVKKFAHTTVARAARFTAMVTAAISLLWRNTSTSIRPMSPTAVCFTGCISWSAMLRPSFWVPTTACPRTIFSLIWTSLLSVLAVEPSVSY